MVIEKVTAFITRKWNSDPELLLFKHPHAGIQIPAGTVETGETPEEAVLREASEETGLSDLTISHYLGAKVGQLPGDQRVIRTHTRVYARPDLNSFGWAHIRPGIKVSVIRTADPFVQIQYQEFDRLPDPQYITYSIKGWVPAEALADTLRRHFFHLIFSGSSPKRWRTTTDNHTFSPFWADLYTLPDIIPPQNEWLTFLDPLIPRE
jgi:8-oxo-dGTP pyrophosphatase MutT (NUDIX family)